MNELKNTVKGRVLVPGDEGFDQARTPWNLAVDQSVRAVVEAADADDVAAVASYARLHGLAVTAQASGHGASGDTEGTILLRTAALGGVEIKDGVARVGAGVKWGEVLTAAGELGLTGLPGSAPAVPVVGYTLGGGLSWFGRKWGYAADSVRAFDVVTADGLQARVTANSDPDLFWALRGGGGDFALVTAMEFDLYPIPHLYGGRILWPVERAPEVLAAFREVTSDAPDELTVWFDLFKFPGGPGLVAIDVTYLGADPGELLRPFDKVDGALSDSRAPMAPADLGSIAAEPTDPSPGLGRAELLTRLDDAVAEVLLGTPIDPLTGVQVRQLGGQLAGRVAEPYSVYMFGQPSEATARRIEELRTALTPYTTGRKPYTFLAKGERAASAFTREELGRLREIKRARDPRGVIRANFPMLG